MVPWLDSIRLLHESIGAIDWLRLCGDRVLRRLVSGEDTPKTVLVRKFRTSHFAGEPAESYGGEELALQPRGESLNSRFKIGKTPWRVEAYPGQEVELKLVANQVECYAGAKADETLRRFMAEGHLMQVADGQDRWYQAESKPERRRADYCKVRAEEGRDYLRKHKLECDEWFFGRPW